MKNVSNITKSIMSRIKIFLDSSALFAGIVSSTGAARVLLLLAESVIAFAWFLWVGQQVFLGTDEVALAER